MPAAKRENEYWFPAKRYGWGWGPPTRWQGWLVLGIYALCAATAGIVFASHRPLAFVACLVLLTLVLFVVCRLKGEKPGWRWGDK
jgi:hypothetical protein